MPPYTTGERAQHYGFLTHMLNRATRLLHTSGHYVPYKYDLTKFVYVGSISVDQIDPSIFCCLTALYKDPGAPLVDLLVVGPSYDVSMHRYRPPYYHRNAASEFMGLIYGDWIGASEQFYAGAIHFENSFVPDGLENSVYRMATDREPPAMKIMENTLGFMFESSRSLLLTDWAWRRPEKRDHNAGAVWGGITDEFSKHREEVAVSIANSIQSMSFLS